MELAVFIWMASIVGGISTFLFLCGAAIIVLVLICSFDAWMDGKAFRPKTWMAPTGLALMLFSAVIPSEKTMYLMAAGFGAQAVVQSETADKVLKIVDGKLDGYLIDMEKVC